jgi:hypothetical protein
VFLLALTGALCEAASPAPFLYTDAPRYESAGGERFPAGAAIQVVENGRTRPLAPGMAASADPSISFDGRRVLFSGKAKARDPWQIWEAPLAGGAPRRITTFAEDTITPFYLAPEWIVCARRTPAGFQIEALPIGGNYSTRLTYAPGDHLVNGVLRDGRILFEAPHPGSTGRDIYTVYPDGSGVESYRCDHARDRHAAMETASGDIVFESEGRLARFTSARATGVDLPAVPGRIAGPIAEATSGEWLASLRSPGSQRYEIVRWRPGAGEPQRVAAGANQAVQPVAVRPHAVPKRHPSALGDREGANLLCLNVYTSRGPIPARRVAQVRVWAMDDGGKPAALGTANVESDGSFYVQTPADRAIRFELLDRAGKTVASEKAWFWARRGEQRVCTGCHAGPERAPENAVPATLLRSTEPARMVLPAETATRGAR